MTAARRLVWPSMRNGNCSKVHAGRKQRQQHAHGSHMDHTRCAIALLASSTTPPKVSSLPAVWPVPVVLPRTDGHSGWQWGLEQQPVGPWPPQQLVRHGVDDQGYVHVRYGRAGVSYACVNIPVPPEACCQACGGGARDVGPRQQRIQQLCIACIPTCTSNNQQQTSEKVQPASNARLWCWRSSCCCSLAGVQVQNTCWHSPTNTSGCRQLGQVTRVAPNTHGGCWLRSGAAVLATALLCCAVDEAR